MAEELQSHDKEYVAGVTFGATTPSYDLEKEIDRFFPHEHITAEAVSAALPAFLGEQDQVAPLFSAKSVDGVRAYELARKLYNANSRSASDDPRDVPEALTHPLAEGGMSSSASSAVGNEIDSAAENLLRVSRINITELELMEFLAGGGEISSPSITVNDMESEAAGASSRINVTDNSELGLPRAVVRMACSKGTYVRAFARDLGEALGSGAHLDSLQRSRSGIFRVENALTVEQAVRMLSNEQ
jgi:tRNA pseudouridine55 synthase